MILDNNEADNRLSSPLNLLNRLRAVSPAGLDGLERKNSAVVSLPPPVSELVEGLDDKLSDAKTLNGASAILAECIGTLRGRMGELKPEKVARIAGEMSKIVTSAKENNSKGQQTVIIFKPNMVSEDTFEVIHVNE